MMWMIITVIVTIYALLTLYRRRQKISDPHNRHVFITGCDTGFGKLLALRLDEMGFHVFAGCLTGNGEEELRKKTSSRLVTVPLDVTNDKSIAEALKYIRQRLPRGKGLWGLVNNAGILENSGMAEWLGKQDYLRTLDVNFFGIVEVTRMFLPLVRQEKGRVVNMSSVVASVAFPVILPYTVSKHAVEVFSDVLRYETLKYGVSVHIIKPVGFQTNMADRKRMKRHVEAVFSRVDDDVKALYGEDYPAKLLTKFTAQGVSDKTYMVVDAYVDALVSLYPRDRYRVGSMASTLWRIMPWLTPAWFQNYALSRLLPPLAGYSRGTH